MKKIKIVYLVLSLFLLTTCNNLSKNNLDNNTNHNESNRIVETKDTESKIERIENIKITVTGDIMYHPWTFSQNKNEETGLYDFSYFYKDMESIIGESDLMIGNFETTSTPSREMSDYPMFNTPENSILDLKNNGFDILTTSNNHCLDSRVQGISDTIDALDKYEILHTGTWKKGEKNYLIKEVKDIKIGILAYTESFNGMEVILKEDEKEMVSPLVEENIKNDIENLKKENIDIIIVFPHWGDEYSTTPNDRQKELGHKILEWGGDIVLGSHPHVLQPVEEILVNGEKKFIAYSMGNSISGQREYYLNTKDVEVGTFISLNFEKDFRSNKTIIKDINIEPTWVKDDRTTGRIQMKTQPMKEYLEGGSLRETISENELNRIMSMREKAINTLESMGYSTGLK